MSATLGDQRSDAALVAAVLAGDRHAFAGIYDRYADRMHDFCWSLLRSTDDAADAAQDTFVIAAGRLHQLRDHDKLRPWLYAVARSVALGRLRARQRERAESELEELVDVTDGPAELAQRRELQDLVWEAAAGLSDRDRMVIDLHLRHGLEGRELATALDVTENNANVMLSRVRDRVERSLGAFLVARLGSEHCPDLQALLRNWDGRFSPLVRKRVARHVDGCDTCDERRRQVASPWALLGTVPLLPAPAELRDRVLGRLQLTSAGRPRGRRAPGRQPGARAAAIALAALLGAGAIVAGTGALRGRAASSDAPTVAAVGAPPAGAPSAAGPGLELSPAALEVPAGGAAVLTLHGSGGGPVAWSADAQAPWLELSRDGGTLAADGLTRVRVAATGAAQPGDRTTVTVTHDGGEATVDVEVTEPGDAGAAAAEAPAPGSDAADPTAPEPTTPRRPADDATPGVVGGTPDDPRPPGEPEPPREPPEEPEPPREPPEEPEPPEDPVDPPPEEPDPPEDPVDPPPSNPQPPPGGPVGRLLGSAVDLLL